MQFEDAPLQPNRSYMCQVDSIERRVKIVRIRNRQGRWFALGVDIDRGKACAFWVGSATPCQA